MIPFIGLTLKHLKKYDAALVQFEKLHEMTRNSPEVIFQIANLLDTLGSQDECIEWMNRLISIVPTDPTVLAFMGDLYGRNGDKLQAFHYYSEASEDCDGIYEIGNNHYLIPGVSILPIKSADCLVAGNLLCREPEL